MSKAIVSSSYLLKMISKLSCSSLDFVTVLFSKGKVIIHGIEIEGHCNAESSHQVQFESIKVLMRILKTFSERPIVIGANSGSSIYLMEVIL